MTDPSSVISHNDGTFSIYTLSSGLWSIETIMQVQLFLKHALYLRGFPQTFQLQAYDSPQTFTLTNNLSGVDTSQYPNVYIPPFVPTPAGPIVNDNSDDGTNNNDANNSTDSGTVVVTNTMSNNDALYIILGVVAVIAGYKLTQHYKS